MIKYYLLPILLLTAVLNNSCKKNSVKPTILDKVIVPDSVDTLLGTYMGLVRYTTEKYASLPQPGHTNYEYDTTYSYDTFYIVKVSADSFRYTNPNWGTWGNNNTIKFSSKNMYTTGEGQSGHFFSINLTFVPSNDSLWVGQSSYSGSYGSSTRSTKEFFGKKQ